MTDIPSDHPWSWCGKGNRPWALSSCTCWLSMLRRQGLHCSLSRTFPRVGFIASSLYLNPLLLEGNPRNNVFFWRDTMSRPSLLKWKERGKVSFAMFQITSKWACDLNSSRGDSSSIGACKGKRNSGDPFRETGLHLEIRSNVHLQESCRCPDEADYFH